MSNNVDHLQSEYMIRMGDIMLEHVTRIDGHCEVKNNMYNGSMKPVVPCGLNRSDVVARQYRYATICADGIK